MRITYDPDVDALYIAFRDARPHDSRDLAEGITVDLDADGRMIGLELLDARERPGRRSPRGSGVGPMMPESDADWIERLERKGAIRRGTGKLPEGWLDQRVRVDADVVAALLQDREESR